MQDSVEDQGALDQVIAHGTAKPDPASHGPGSQTRDVGVDAGMKPSFGIKRQTSDSPATSPSKIGATNAPVARKP
jgi:hypothetical protein